MLGDWFLQAEIDRLRRRVSELEGQLKAQPVLRVGTIGWTYEERIRAIISIPSYKLDDSRYVHSSMDISPLMWERARKEIRPMMIDRLTAQAAVEWLKGRDVITIDDEKLLEDAA